MSHVKNLTTSFKAMPPERFKDKLGRTIAGVLLALVGFGSLYAQNRGYLPKGEWLERIGLALVALGCLTASYEFISLPVRWLVALVKDLLAFRKANGNPPV